MFKSNITREMKLYVIAGLKSEISKKGKANGMVSVLSVERSLLDNGVKEFVPVSLVVRELIQDKVLRYYRLNNGVVVYGFTKNYQEEFFGSPVQQAPTLSSQAQDFKNDAAVEISDNDKANAPLSQEMQEKVQEAFA